MMEKISLYISQKLNLIKKGKTAEIWSEIKQQWTENWIQKETYKQNNFIGIWKNNTAKINEYLEKL